MNFLKRACTGCFQDRRQSRPVLLCNHPIFSRIPALARFPGFQVFFINGGHYLLNQILEGIDLTVLAPWKEFLKGSQFRGSFGIVQRINPLNGASLP